MKLQQSAVCEAVLVAAEEMLPELNYAACCWPLVPGGGGREHTALQGITGEEKACSHPP